MSKVFYSEDYKNTNELKNALKIGMWATICCNLDMFEIKSQDDIEDILKDYEDELGSNYTLSNTKEEMLEYFGV